MSAHLVIGSEKFTDCQGNVHAFCYTSVPVIGGGYLISASEQLYNSDRNGYEFLVESNKSCAPKALRATIRRQLSIKYLSPHEEERGYCLNFNKAEGRIVIDGVVIDGQFIRFEELTKLMQHKIGWKFELTMKEFDDE